MFGCCLSKSSWIYSNWRPNGISGNNRLNGTWYPYHLHVMCLRVVKRSLLRVTKRSFFRVTKRTLDRIVQCLLLHQSIWILMKLLLGNGRRKDRDLKFEEHRTLSSPGWVDIVNLERLVVQCLQIERQIEGSVTDVKTRNDISRKMLMPGSINHIKTINIKDLESTLGSVFIRLGTTFLWVARVQPRPDGGPVAPYAGPSFGG